MKHNSAPILFGDGKFLYLLMATTSREFLPYPFPERQFPTINCIHEEFTSLHRLLTIKCIWLCIITCMLLLSMFDNERRTTKQSYWLIDEVILERTVNCRMKLIGCEAIMKSSGDREKREDHFFVYLPSQKLTF